MEEIIKFWDESSKGAIFLDHYEFKMFLEHHQYFKNKPNSESVFNLIVKNGMFLQIKDPTEIKDFVIDYILGNDLGKKVFNLIASKSTLFTRQYLSMVKTEEINILRDTKDKAYLFYQNGVVEVTKDSKVLKEYKDYKLHIWEDQVIKRDFHESDHHKSEYREFIWKISGGFDLPQSPTNEQLSRYKTAVDRYNTFQTVIGYLLHSFNSGGDNKAIILNDEMISDDPNGRSGKGLFWNGIKQLKKVQSLNGKKFNFNDPFPYQSVKTDCQVLVWDDVRRNFDFEQLFSVITEGIEITYKGKDTIKLPIEDSPKILITTNYTIRGKGGSHEARKFEVELSSFFNEKYSPIDYFGHKLFDGWDQDEWARFDSYMMECLKKYLNTGLVGYNAINLPLKKLQVEIGIELYKCIEILEIGSWIDSNEFYEIYKMTVRKFTEKSKTAVTQSIKKYCEFHDLKFDQQRSAVTKFKIYKDNQFTPTQVDVWDEIENNLNNGIVPK